MLLLSSLLHNQLGLLASSFHRGFLTCILFSFSLVFTGVLGSAFMVINLSKFVHNFMHVQLGIYWFCNSFAHWFYTIHASRPLLST